MAILYFVSGLIGRGAGPFITGLVNDLLAPEYGVLAIRYSLVEIVNICVVAGGIIFLIGSRHLHRDLRFVGVLE